MSHADGNVYFATGDSIKRLTPEETRNTVAGPGGPLAAPETLALTPEGDLLIADPRAGLVLRLSEPQACDPTVRPPIYDMGLGNAGRRSGVAVGILGPFVISGGSLRDPARGAPGMVMTVYGVRLGPVAGVAADSSVGARLPLELAGVSAAIEGRPAGVLYASAGQVNLGLPYDAPESGQAELVVTVDGVESEPYMVEMEASSPGVLAVLNEGGAPNDAAHPAVPGSEFSLLVSGLGRPPAEADALAITEDVIPWPAEEIEIEVNRAGGAASTPFAPLWARSRPGALSSVAEVRFEVPEDVQISPQVARVKMRRNGGEDTELALYVAAAPEFDDRVKRFAIGRVLVSAMVARAARLAASRVLGTVVRSRRLATRQACPLAPQRFSGALAVHRRRQKPTVIVVATSTGWPLSWVGL